LFEELVQDEVESMIEEQCLNDPCLFEVANVDVTSVTNGFCVNDVPTTNSVEYSFDFDISVKVQSVDYSNTTQTDIDAVMSGCLVTEIVDEATLRVLGESCYMDSDSGSKSKSKCTRKLKSKSKTKSKSKSKTSNDLVVGFEDGGQWDVVPTGAA